MLTVFLAKVWYKKSNFKNNITNFNWMMRELNRNFKHYDDSGEVNCTLLAENCADSLDLYEDDDDYTIPEVVFDDAVLAADKYLKR